MQKIARIMILRCCCCGCETRGRQWWNRDRGFGLCPTCADEYYKDPREAQSMAGERGYNWDIKDA